MIRLGYHMSIAGSIVNAPRDAVAKGYTAFQIFTTNSRSWAHRPVDERDAEEFKSIVKAHDIAVNAHCPYLSNPSSTRPEIYKKSIEMIIDNVGNCNELEINALVIHIGSHLGKGLKYGMDNVCGALDTVLGRTKGTVILLENSAGYNNSVGSNFAEIGEIIDRVGSERVGVCLDTVHAFAAGYELRTPEGVQKMVDEFDDEIGLKRLRLVHISDTKYDIGSGLDRHWHIGMGKIGRKGFLSFFGNKVFQNGNFVMETPLTAEADDTDNYKTVLSIIKEAQIRS